MNCQPCKVEAPRVKCETCGANPASHCLMNGEEITMECIPCFEERVRLTLETSKDVHIQPVEANNGLKTFVLI